MNIEEKILYTETNKIRRKKAEHEYKRDQVRHATKSTVGIPSVPAFVEEIYSEAQEKEIIRLLMHYGDMVLYTYKDDKFDEEREVKVAEYIITEIMNDDLEFKNLVYKQIF